MNINEKSVSITGYVLVWLYPYIKLCIYHTVDYNQCYNSTKSSLLSTWYTDQVHAEVFQSLAHIVTGNKYQYISPTVTQAMQRQVSNLTDSVGHKGLSNK